MPADPGRSWFERFHKAFLDEDPDAIWDLQTEASHALLLERLAETLQRVEAEPEMGQMLADRMGHDIRGMQPREAWETYTRESCRQMAAGFVTLSYAGEEREGDRCIVRLVAGGPHAEAAGTAGEVAQVLLREGDAWKLDKPATEALLRG